jgi:phenylacetate-CoA ligase
MFFDPTTRPLNLNAYSDLPFTFLDQAAQNDLANIAAINLIENGDRLARENWQSRQLTKLLRHAQARSAFWRKRLPSRTINARVMKYVPVQSRADIATQVNLEGSLVAADGSAPSSYASTGSTGTPVKIFGTRENGYYNVIRSLAQYFINGLSLDEDRLQIFPAPSLAKLNSKSLSVELKDSWAGPLSQVFRSGSAKIIIDQYDDGALMQELSKGRAGYLVCASRYLDVIIRHGGIDFIKQLGIKVWLHLNDYRDPETVKALESIGVRCLSSYSAAEVGPIAFECPTNRGHFHVAHSNVLVECDESTTVPFEGTSLGRLLITHLHSYATPVIRYDIGDFGKLEQRCPCGHDGPVITSIFGRGKHFLKHPKGHLLPFYVSTRMLLQILEFKEFRVRQDRIDTITVEIGDREDISADEEAALRDYLIKATDPAFNIEIRPVTEIDWTANPKRLFFVSSVA